MKKKYKHSLIMFFLISLLFLWGNSHYEILAFHPFYDSYVYDFKVLTWNIHCPNGTDEFQQRQIAERIIEIDADYVFLIEYRSDSCTIIDSVLRRRYMYNDISASHTLCGNAIYSKKILNNTKVLNTPHGAMFLQNISATLCINRDSILIIGIHLPSNNMDACTILNSIDTLKQIDSLYNRYKDNQDKRKWCMSFIKRWVSEQHNPAIVLGDFNDFSFSAPCDSLKDIGMKDSWWEGGLGFGYTFHEGWMNFRIDHIFHSQELKLCGVKVISTELSDHNPIIASFSIN